jgi:hypothetical protein
VRELLLDGFGIGQFQRTQNQALWESVGVASMFFISALKSCLPAAGHRPRQAEFATVHETRGAEQATGQLAAQT